MYASLYDLTHKRLDPDLLFLLGLGVCSLVEFGRYLAYNILVDGSSGNDDEDSEDEDSVAAGAELVGYKQLLLVLQSNEVETGKSLLANIASRIFHGKKVELMSTISFNNARTMLGRGEPIIIGECKS